MNDTEPTLPASDAALLGLGLQPVPEVETLAPLFPEYELLEQIGIGGMGVVYKARHRRLDRLVAVKLLHPRIADDRAFHERFEREAQVMARLTHPGIVTIYDFGERDGLFFLVMQWIEGANLRELMRDGLAPAAALNLVSQICEALTYAHERGVVHRDIKPENILVDGQGQAKLADFGLAKLRRMQVEGAQLTGSLHVLGTPHYMAPEQLERARDVDHRADIFALGVVLYEMLTGKLPLGHFAPPSRLCPIDARIDDVVLRAMASDIDERYQHASEVRSGIAGLQAAADERAASSVAEGHGASAEPVTKTERSPTQASMRTFRRRRWLLPLLISLLTVGLIGIAGLFMSVSSWRPPPSQPALFANDSENDAVRRLNSALAHLAPDDTKFIFIDWTQVRESALWKELEDKLAGTGAECFGDLGNRADWILVSAADTGKSQYSIALNGSWAPLAFERCLERALAASSHQRVDVAAAGPYTRMSSKSGSILIGSAGSTVLLTSRADIGTDWLTERLASEVIPFGLEAREQLEDHLDPSALAVAASWNTGQEAVTEGTADFYNLRVGENIRLDGVALFDEAQHAERYVADSQGWAERAEDNPLAVFLQHALTLSREDEVVHMQLEVPTKTLLALIESSLARR